jgi:hypothetical protein
MAADEENRFEHALGFAVVRRWADLSRETQQLGNGHGEGFRREVDRDRPYSSRRPRQRAALTMAPLPRRDTFALSRHDSCLLLSGQTEAAIND